MKDERRQRVLELLVHSPHEEEQEEREALEAPVVPLDAKLQERLVAAALRPEPQASVAFKGRPAVDESSDWVAVFFQDAPEHVQLLTVLSAEERRQCEHLLRQAWEAGSEQWPDVALPQEVYVRHLAALLPPLDAADPVPDVLQFLAQGAHGDLYLACACAQGIPAAIQAFERHYLDQLPMTLGHLRQLPVAVEEICQQLRIELLVPTPERGPKIAQYSGRAPLRSWVRVMATSSAISMLRAAEHGPEEPSAVAFEALLPTESNPELNLFKRNDDRDIRRALADAFAALSKEERILLRFYFVDKLSTPQIGLLLRVGPSTVVRRFTSILQRLYEETKRRLLRRLDGPSEDFETVVREIDDLFDSED